MDKRVMKLAHKGLDQDVAEKLVQANLSTPRQIKAAPDKDLKGIPGIGDATLSRIRERIGRAG